jgi:alkylation response protein AidB-like acyl-CoA dehydrogenase
VRQEKGAIDVLGLSEADLRIRDTARAFTDSLVQYEVEAETNGGTIAADLVTSHRRRAIELGLYATNMPLSVGGAGYTMLQQVLVQEQAGRVTNALAWVMHTPPAWWVDVATDLQKQRWLLPTVRGELHECYAITEEFAGSDVSALATTARRDGADYVLSGVKWHVTSFNLAQYALVQARLVEGANAGQHVLLVVDLPSPGVTVLRTPSYSHHIPDEHPVVEFRDVRVPSSHLIGTEGDGMTFAHDWFRFERIMVAARCVGAGQRLVEETTAFAAHRRVGGQRLGDHQLVAGMLADSATELFAARALLYEVARGADAGADRKVMHARASMAKLYCSETAGRIADRCVQVFGGRGYMRENVAERMYRELRVERIWEGASELQRLIVARQLLNTGPDSVLGS